jgi:diphthine synthase
LADEKGITLRGLEAARECGTVFMESYTSTLSTGSVERLNDLIGIEIALLDREGVEGGDIILEKTKITDVCLLVAGDPMSATTHQDLRLRAQELGIETEIIGGVSALTAIPAALGLQIYKFGRTITVPIPQPNFNPTSFYEKALENFKMGMHTLLLLDIQQEKGLYMTANDAMKSMMEAEEELKGGLMAQERLVCVAARAGSQDPLFKAGYLNDMVDEDFGPPLHSVVIPGELHFLEAMALVEFCSAPKEILEE